MDGKENLGFGVLTVMKTLLLIQWAALTSIARITAALVASREGNG